MTTGLIRKPNRHSSRIRSNRGLPYNTATDVLAETRLHDNSILSVVSEMSVTLSSDNRRSSLNLHDRSPTMTPAIHLQGRNEPVVIMESFDTRHGSGRLPRRTVPPQHTVAPMWRHRSSPSVLGSVRSLEAISSSGHRSCQSDRRHGFPTRTARANLIGEIRSIKCCGRQAVERSLSHRRANQCPK